MKYTIYILLLICTFFIPKATYGQADRERAKVAYDRLKSKGYDTNVELGDTAFISAGDSISKIMLLLDREKTKYNSLEEAAMDVTRLLNVVSEEKTSAQKVTGGLGFKIAQRKILNKQKDEIARDAWEELISKEETTVEDLIELRARFGNKPTFYVNGYEVQQDVLNRLRETDVLTREYRVTNTASGNPNGEIWYEITPKAAKRIELDNIIGIEYVTPQVIPASEDNTEQFQQNVKPLPVVIEEEIIIEEIKVEEPKPKKIEEISSDKPMKRSVRTVKENIKNKK